MRLTRHRIQLIIISFEQQYCKCFLSACVSEIMRKHQFICTRKRRVPKQFNVCTLQRCIVEILFDYEFSSFQSFEYPLSCLLVATLSRVLEFRCSCEYAVWKIVKLIVFLTLLFFTVYMVIDIFVEHLWRNRKIIQIRRQIH